MPLTVKQVLDYAALTKLQTGDISTTARRVVDLMEQSGDYPAPFSNSLRVTLEQLFVERVSRGRVEGAFQLAVGSTPIPILLDALNSLTGWLAADGAPLSLSAAGIRVQGDGVQGRNPSAVKSLDTPYDPTLLGLIAFPITIEETPIAVSSEFQIGVGGRYYSNVLGQNQKLLREGAAPLPPGTYWQVMNVADLGRYETEGTDDVYTTGAIPAGAAPLKVRLKLRQTTTTTTFPGAAAVTDNPPHNARISFGKVYAQVKVPKVPIVMTFDDSENTINSVAQPALDAIGAKATAYLVPLTVTHKGTAYPYNNANKMTNPQWLAWKAAGHAIACGSPGDISDTAAVNTSVADAIAGVDVVRQYITDNGLDTGDSFHHCYSGTNPAANHDLAQFTGTPLQGSMTVTAAQTAFTLAADPGATLAVGNRVRGFNIPLGTTIATLAGDRLSGTLSAPALASGTVQVMFEDIAQPFFRGKLQSALRSAGYKTVRATGVGTGTPGQFAQFGLGDQDMLLEGKGWGPASTQAQVNNWINAGIKYGTVLCTYIHRILPSPTGVNMSDVLFQQLVDGLNAQVQAGKAEWLTISQFYAKYGTAQPPF